MSPPCGGRRLDSKLKIAPGKEEEFRYWQEWLAASATIDRIIEESDRVSEDLTSDACTAPI